MYFGQKHFRDLNIDARFFFVKFKKLPGATFLCVAFFTAVPKYGPKFKKTRKNDQIVIPTFCTSHIRTNAREILLNT